MNNEKERVCPAERAGGLESGIRRWLQNPRKLLAPYLKKGMTAVDYGCGPGFFTLEMAKLVGETGRVIAVDLQEEMLQKVREKLRGSPLAHRITLHKCEQDNPEISLTVDFVLAFYVVHEIPNQQAFFREINKILKPDGLVFIVEPPIHVSKAGFEEMIVRAGEAGLSSVAFPRVLLNKTVLLKKD